ncbi:hypothetical protein RMATCC62417_04065 [Rhizopus microsporus]|nr:hypothetical protein RMATCC62417_04065 [Rhizopus microsporus]
METIDVDNTWSLYKKLYLTLDSTQLLRPLDLPIDTTKDNANLFTINNGKRPSSSSIACLEELQTRSKRIKRFEESASEEKKARLLTRLDIPLNDYFKSRLKYHQVWLNSRHVSFNNDISLKV